MQSNKNNKKGLEKNIKNLNLIPYFHSVQNLNSQVEYFECLARIAEYEDVSPLQFLPMIVKLNKYESFTKMMIEKSFQYCKKKNVFFSINLNFSDIQNKNTIDFLTKLIEKYNIGEHLIIEIIEDDIEDFRIVANFTNRIKKYGVKIAIDDFGMKFSNLTHLLYFEPDIIKIDGFLAKNINLNNKAKIIIKAVVDLAVTLDIKVVAEYVKDEMIFNELKKLGVDMFQGYYFSRPQKEIKT